MKWRKNLFPDVTLEELFFVEGKRISPLARNILILLHVKSLPP